MQKKSAPQIVERRGTRLYRCCRTTTTIFWTLILLLPAIYILGAQESYHNHRPLYAVYQNEQFYQSKIQEVQSLLQAKESILAINLHCGLDRTLSQEERTRNWQNLLDFTDYLGYSLNIKSISTVSQTISLPEIKQKRNKKEALPESIKSLEESYRLNKFGSVNNIKTKLNKAANNILKKLKIQLAQPTGNKWLEQLRYQFIKTVHSPKIWLIVIQSKNFESHSSELLKKQLIAIGKERPRDKFIVISQWPVDPTNHRVKQVSVSINEQVLTTMRTQIQTQILQQLNLSPTNYPKTSTAVICKTNCSLLQLNNFVFNCKHSSCLSYLELLAKKSIKKQQKDQQYAGISKALKDLCEKGTPFREDDWDRYSKILGSIGQEKDTVEDSLRYYYELANGDKCKSQKPCNIQWLYASKVKQQNITNDGPGSIQKQADQVPIVQSSSSTSVFDKSNSQTDATESTNPQQIQQSDESRGQKVKQQQLLNNPSPSERTKKGEKKEKHSKGKKKENKKEPNQKSKGKQKKGNKSARKQKINQDLVRPRAVQGDESNTNEAQIEENQCIDESCASEANLVTETASIQQEKNDQQSLTQQNNSLNIEIPVQDEGQDLAQNSQSNIESTENSNQQQVQTDLEEEKEEAIETNQNEGQNIQINQSQESLTQQAHQIQSNNSEIQEEKTVKSQHTESQQAVRESDQ